MQGVENYSSEFKAQLAKKVLSRIEKRFASSHELTEAEAQCVKEVQTTHEMAKL